jgi:hypothetical protein
VASFVQEIGALSHRGTSPTDEGAAECRTARAEGPQP